MQSKIANVRTLLARFKWAAETTLMLAFARLLIKFAPFRYWRGTLGVIGATVNEDNGSQGLNQERARVGGRWVRRVAAKMPFEAVCLPQAMAGRWMLGRRGLPCKIYLGTKKEDGAGGFAYHAWLMHGDICLTGQHERDSFTIFSQHSSAPKNLA